jgi:starch-binding outer membrane protein, SusD/RagB family
MKRIIYLSLFVLLFGSSCSDFLELDPKEQIPTEAALQNGNNVESTLLSAYGELASDNFLGLRVRLYSELLSDNIGLNEVTLSATDFTGQVALRNTNILNKDVDAVWSTAYRAISRANSVIDAVDRKLITYNATVDQQIEWKAEAQFIRAIAHFELTRLFGKPYSNAPSSDLGVPLRTVALTVDEKLPRATVEQVYTKVIADLTEAIENLPPSNGNRASSWAAKGYLARVYFNMLDYNNAFEITTEIIDEGFVLEGDPLTSFGNSGNVDPDGGVLFQLVSGGNSFGAFRPSSNQWSISTASNGPFDLISGRGADDFRFDEMVVSSGIRQFSTKWDENVINPPIIRMAEIFLIHAESAASKSIIDLAQASSSYNEVRGFAETGFTPVTFTIVEDALEAIQEERRIELLFEGDRYHELKRLKTASFGQVGTGANIIREAKPYNDASWLLKIPVSETSGNPNIVQN